MATNPRAHHDPDSPGRDPRGGLTRREILGGLAAVTAVAGGVGALPLRASGSPRIAVVGAGAFGGWTALHLLRKGADVTLFDAWGPGNPRSSSGGEGRAIRAIYGPDRIYTEWVARAFELWAELERGADAHLYEETGALWMMENDDGYVRSALPILEELGFPVESPPVAEAARRWPQIDFEGVGNVWLERRAGVLFARDACRVVAERFAAEGGTVRLGRVTPGPVAGGVLTGASLGDGTPLHFDAWVFALGPWLGRIFPEVVGDGVRPSRQEVHYFGPPAGSALYRPPSLPIWVDFATRSSGGERVVYGFPDVHGRGFKMADDTRGETVDPDTLDRRPSAEALAASRDFLARRFPGLAEAPLVEARVCQYENSPDGDLILDRHPEAENVWLAGGGSGHGFKLSPAVGEHVAGLVLAGSPGLERFGLARLGSEASGRTQFDADAGS